MTDSKKFKYEKDLEEQGTIPASELCDLFTPMLHLSSTALKAHQCGDGAAKFLLPALVDAFLETQFTIRKLFRGVRRRRPMYADGCTLVRKQIESLFTMDLLLADVAPPNQVDRAVVREDAATEMSPSAFAESKDRDNSRESYSMRFLKSGYRSKREAYEFIDSLTSDLPRFAEYHALAPDLLTGFWDAIQSVADSRQDEPGTAKGIPDFPTPAEAKKLLTKDLRADDKLALFYTGWYRVYRAYCNIAHGGFDSLIAQLAPRGPVAGIPDPQWAVIDRTCQEAFYYSLCAGGCIAASVYKLTKDVKLALACDKFWGRLSSVDLWSEKCWSLRICSLLPPRVESPFGTGS